MCQGMTLKQLPMGLSRVPIRILGVEGNLMSEAQLLAGFVGVSQDTSLAVQPHIGWGVVDGIDDRLRIDDY